MKVSQAEFDRQKKMIITAIEVLNSILGKAEKAGVGVSLIQHYHDCNTDYVLIHRFTLGEPRS